MWRLQRACEAQVLTDAMAGANIPVPAAVALRNVDDANNFGGDGSVADKFLRGAGPQGEPSRPLLRDLSFFARRRGGSWWVG